MRPCCCSARSRAACSHTWYTTRPRPSAAWTLCTWPSCGMRQGGRLGTLAAIAGALSGRAARARGPGRRPAPQRLHNSVAWPPRQRGARSGGAGAGGPSDRGVRAQARALGAGLPNARAYPGPVPGIPCKVSCSVGSHLRSSGSLQYSQSVIDWKPGLQAQGQERAAEEARNTGCTDRAPPRTGDAWCASTANSCRAAAGGTALGCAARWRTHSQHDQETAEDRHQWHTDLVIVLAYVSEHVIAPCALATARSRSETIRRAYALQSPHRPASWCTGAGLKSFHQRSAFLPDAAWVPLGWDPPWAASAAAKMLRTSKSPSPSRSQSPSRSPPSAGRRL